MMVATEVKTLEEFNSLLVEAKEHLVVVDFHASWCGPCRVIAPKLEALSTKYSNMKVLKVDVDENEDIAERYNITAMPTFLFFKKMEKIDELVGAKEKKLEEMIEKYS